MNWFINCFTKNYVNFNGRARRQEYWMFILFLLIIQVVNLSVIGFISETLSAILYLIVAFGSLLPNLAVTARRLHDTNKSGWLMLIALIPLVGGIILIVFLATDSTPGSNQYGENPKGIQ